MVKNRKKQHIKYSQIALSLIVTGAIIASSFFIIEDISIKKIFNSLLKPIVRLTVYISLGLLIGQIIELAGWTSKISLLARPLFKFSRLGDRCASTFIAAFVSGVTSNAMLVNYYKEGTISEKQVYATNFVNHLPGFFLHFPTTFFIVIPLTGIAGSFYFLITFLATVFRVSLVLVYSHFFLPLPLEYTMEVKRHKPSTFHEILQNIKKKLPPRIARIVVWILPIYTIVYIMNSAGLFRFLNNLLSGYFHTNIVPMESLSIVMLSFYVEFTSGFAAAGALLNSGVITTKQTVIALLAGNIIAFPLRALRHQLPMYMGIFSPKMGLIMMVVGQLFRIVSIILIGFLYYLFF